MTSSKQKTALSFYCDDTNPYDAPPEAFKIFLDYAAAEGIAGESSVIPGFHWRDQGVLSQRRNKVQEEYIEQVQRAFSCGIDTHCELMTHEGLYDFAAGRMPEGVVHEGLWMFEPGVSVAEYEAYFGKILAEGERIGLRYTGVTWPGCSCDACNRRYAELRAAGVTEPNPNVWQGLLNLAKKEKFRSKTVPCFVGGEVDQAQARRTAKDGVYAVYDLQPNTADRFGIWLNSLEYVNVDYYISADGQSGRIVDLVRANTPYCLFFAHWQGLNPVNGVGWEPFKQVVSRVNRHLRDQIVWVRPSEYTDSLV